MSGPVDEDQEQRETSAMKDSDAMTIEFLRARLLSERSVSNSARQRAAELAKRVAELEEQLHVVSVQRKRAEKATADVLAILGNHGISDVSEEYDSCSDQDETSHDFKAHNGSVMTGETSTKLKYTKNEIESYSSSEIESSPSTGRSLSWKSTKESQYSLEKKKYADSFRRRASFGSNSSSGRRVGKSCRKIRRRDTRSVEELQNEGTEKATCPGDVSNCSDGEPVALRERTGDGSEENPPEKLTESVSQSQNVNGHYSSGHERDEDMESALQHQEQLIGQYEKEEKAQREWEEKFRENNSGTQDSCDPGNHSDVTEERYDIRLPGPLYILNSDNQELKLDPSNARSSAQPQISNVSPPLSDAGKGNERSSPSEFSFPLPKEKSNHQELPRKHDELAVVPRETSNGLGSVLEALQRAKLSLNQKLNSSSSKLLNPETNIVDDQFKVPVHSPGLFRLPTDNQFEATASVSYPCTVGSARFANLPTEIAGTRLLTGQQSGFANLPPEIAGNRLLSCQHSGFVNFPPEIACARLLSEPYVESRNASSRDVFLTVPHRPFPGETRSGRPFVIETGSSTSASGLSRPFISETGLGRPPLRSLSQPRPSEGEPSSSTMNHLSPYMGSVLQSFKEPYPFVPDITLRLPLNEGTSRTFPGSESGLPPGTRSSTYDDRVGPSMYR